MFTSIVDIEKKVKSGRELKKLVLAAAEDVHALEAVVNAHENGIIHPILVGNRKRVLEIGVTHSFDLSAFEIVDEPSHELAVEKSVKMIGKGEADILMKGKCSTATLMRGILNKEWGMRKNKLLSHFALFEIPTYHKLLALTDVAINMEPDLAEKKSILENSVAFMIRLGWECPKVAVIAAVELVNDSMQATLDAAALSVMASRNQISSCLVDGPLALDSAISAESAKQKKIDSEVAGDADLLVFPQLESGNVMYKSLAFLAGGSAASVVLGATAPVVLTSRADSQESKLNSIMLAAASEINKNS